MKNYMAYASVTFFRCRANYRQSTFEIGSIRMIRDERFERKQRVVFQLDAVQFHQKKMRNHKSSN